MTDLTEFVRARLDEDERTAQRGYYSDTLWELFTTTAHLGAWQAWREQYPREQWDKKANDVIADATRDAIRDCIAAHEAERTARVLREITEKRQLLDEFERSGSMPNTPERRASSEWPAEFGYLQGLARAVHLLAAVYDDHPDYDEAWRP